MAFFATLLTIPTWNWTQFPFQYACATSEIYFAREWITWLALIVAMAISRLRSHFPRGFSQTLSSFTPRINRSPMSDSRSAPKTHDCESEMFSEIRPNCASQIFFHMTVGKQIVQGECFVNERQPKFNHRNMKIARDDSTVKLGCSAWCGLPLNASERTSERALCC